MAVLLAGAAWASLILWLFARMLRQLVAHHAASLDGAAPPDAPVPDVAIIVPARNEIANIADCLACLSAQCGLSAASSITVVDDGSQDGTAAAVAAAARRDRRIALVEAGLLPSGWMGKPHACWRGAMASTAEWLCFLDADVRAAPELIAASVGAAERQAVDMLSLHPFQLLGSFWERLIIPAGLVLVACAKDLRPVHDPASREISANGQFILIRRAVYLAVGGHAAVRGEVAEDKALAARVKRAGWNYRMLFAETLARTRMYTDFSSLWEGLSKNATEIMGGAASTVAVTTAAMVAAWSALLLPLLSGLGVARHPSAATLAGFGLALLGSLAVAGVQLGTTRHFRIPMRFGLLFPLAYRGVAALACHRAALRRDGRVTWKGRTYRLDREA